MTAHRHVRILTAEKIASLNDNDLQSYKKAAGELLREKKRSSVRWPLPGTISETEQKRINALTWAFREAGRETARREAE